jgi:ribosomal protein L24
LFTSKISESVIEGHTAFQQSQVAEQKTAADQALVEGVEYVDTSAYEQYEKQEGDFVEGEVATDETAETTVPPDEESR